MSEHSSYSLDLMRISGDLHGIAVIKINGLYLQQDFLSSFNEVVPHEVGHVLYDLECKEADRETGKQHCDEWEDTVAQLSPDANPSAKVKGLFDDRAPKILKGGICVECECGDQEAFAVYPDSATSASKLRNEELRCKQCTFPYIRVTKDKWPEKVKADIEFLLEVRAIKLHNQHLQR
jgi:predicted SprT family Zn-dependent metalloprotease